MGCLFSYVSLFCALILPNMEANTPAGLGVYERQACTTALMMQVGSILVDVFARQQLSAKQFWVVRAIFFVKLIAACTNAAILLMPSSFILDSVTGRPNCMLRWVEWIVLAFMMTFVVDSIDAGPGVGRGGD